MFSYQAWTAWKLKGDLAGYKDQFNKEFEEKSYMFRNIDLANRGVALGFFAFGAGYTVQDFLNKLGMNHVFIYWKSEEMSIFLLNHVIVRLTKIMNNLLKNMTLKVNFRC